MQKLLYIYIINEQTAETQLTGQSRNGNLSLRTHDWAGRMKASAFRKQQEDYKTAFKRR